MYKVIPSDSYDFGEPALRLVKFSRCGLGPNDAKALLKFANADFVEKIARLDRKPGEAIAHNIALGATEWFGPNRNGDGFKEAECEANHGTFVTHGRAFRGHRNSDPAKSYGIIKASHYNKDQHRIELAIAYNATKEAAERNGGLVADEEIKALEKDGEFPTSMACSLDPAALVLTSGGYTRIDAVEVGDLVYTHARRWRRVTTLRRRRYTGPAVRMRCEGLPVDIELTADHLLRAKILSDYPASRFGQRPAGQWTNAVAEGEEAFSWLHASHLGLHDRLEMVPVTSAAARLAIGDARLCELLGIYCAEGSIHKTKGRLNGVCLGIHAKDWAVDGVPRIIADLWPDVVCHLYPHRTSSCAFLMLIASAELSRFADRFVGQICTSKRLPLELFNSPDECRKAFLGRWLDGDGWCDLKGGHWSSANLGLVLQGRDLLLSLGVPSSLYKIDHAKCATSGHKNSGVEYTLNVSNMDIGVLADYSAKVAANPHTRSADERTKPPTLMPVGNSYAYRIKHIEFYDVVDAPTWNLEVEEDHSYTLYGVGSHNCKIAHDICSSCSNKARHRKEYCDGSMCKHGGLRRNIGRTFSDGHTLHADNPNCTWFDMSMVKRGADRTCYTLGLIEKAAHAVRCGAELAEDYGLVDYAAAYEGLGKLAVFAKAAADLGAPPAPGDARLAAFLPGVQPSPACPHDLRAHPEKFAGVMRALADEKVVLPPRAFFNLVLADEAVSAAAESAVAPLLKRAYAEVLADEALLASNPYAPGDRPASLSDSVWAAKAAEHHGLDPARVARRAALASLRGASGPINVNRDRPSVKSAAAAGELARCYALYKVAALSHWAGDPLLYPRLAAAAVLQDCAII